MHLNVWQKCADGVKELIEELFFAPGPIICDLLISMLGYNISLED